MLKKFVSILMALTFVMALMPTGYAADGDLFYYDFSNYTGQNTLSAGSGTFGAQNIIAEGATGISRGYATGVGGKDATDTCVTFTVNTAISSEVKTYFGPQTTNFPQTHWSYYGGTNKYVTVQYDVYNATENGYFKLFGTDGNWNGTRKWDYTVPASELSKNTWHTVAVEFYRNGTGDNLTAGNYYAALYVDGKLISKDTTNLQWMRRPLINCVAPAGTSAGEYFAVDNYRIYAGQYEGKPYYTNTFDNTTFNWNYDNGNIELKSSANGTFLNGLYGKGVSDNSVAFVYNNETTKYEPFVYYKSNNVKYDGVTTMEISYLDTTGVAEPKVETNYYKEDGSSTASVVLNYTYAENALAFTLGGNPLNDENGYTRKFARKSCWNEFAITYDAPNNTITWYFNGELLATKTIDSLGYTNKVKFCATVPTGASGIVAFDDLKVYKGAYDAVANNAAVTTNDESIIIRNKVINVFSVSAVTPDALKAKLNLPGTAAVYADMVAFSDGTVSTANIGDGNLFVSVSENGEQFELYTINLVNSNDKFSITEPVISFEDNDEVTAATVDFINYTDEEKEYMLVFAVYENSELAYVKVDSAKLSFGEAELKVSDKEYADWDKIKIMLWDKSTMAPVCDYLDAADVDAAWE